MKDVVAENPKSLNGGLSRSWQERNDVAGHYPNGRTNGVNGDKHARYPGRTGMRRTAFVPQHIAARALATPALNGLLPVAIGVCAHVSNEPPERSAGAGGFILLYCSAGHGWCEVNGRRHNVAPGEIVIIPPDVPYAFGAAPGQQWRVSWARVGGANLDSILSQLEVSIEKPVIDSGAAGTLQAWFIEMLEAIEEGCGPAHLLRASESLTRLFVILINHHREHGRADHDVQRKIVQSIAYMKEHLDQPLRVATLAAQASISLPHYFALFKRLTGNTPIDFFIHLRMDRAGQLLNTTDLSVKEIAATLGYDDPFYFSRMFKSVHLMAPSEYRSKLENNKRPVNGHDSARGMPRFNGLQRQLVPG